MAKPTTVRVASCFLVDYFILYRQAACTPSEFLAGIQMQNKTQLRFTDSVIKQQILLCGDMTNAVRLINTHVTF